MRKIKIPDLAWGSDSASIILDLEKLRTKRLGGDVPPYYTDRNGYYDMLSKVDSFKDEDILAWCEYFFEKEG